LQLQDCHYDYQETEPDFIDSFPSPPPPDDYCVPSSPKALSIMTMSPLTATMVDDDFDQYFDEEQDDGETSDPCVIKPIAWNPSESYSYDEPSTPKTDSYCNTFCGLQSFTRQQGPQKAIPIEIDKSYSEMVGIKSFGYSHPEAAKFSLSSPPRLPSSRQSFY